MAMLKCLGQTYSVLRDTMHPFGLEYGGQRIAGHEGGPSHICCILATRGAASPKMPSDEQKELYKGHST